MNGKKFKVGLIIMLMLGIMSVFSLKTYALSPPYMSLNTTQDVITHDNAVLHAKFFDAGVTGVEVIGFEIFVYKDNILVKSGVKTNDKDNRGWINIVFDLKKDLSIVLLPNTTYTYTICAKINGNVSMERYKQSFHFTTSKESDIVVQETTSKEPDTIIKETTSDAIRVKTPGITKIKSVKNKKKRTVVIKYKRITGAKKYQIQYAKNRKFKQAVTKNTKKLIFTIRRLKKSKKYYIRVRGVNGTKRGRWSKVKGIVIKK